MPELIKLSALRELPKCYQYWTITGTFEKAVEDYNRRYPHFPASVVYECCRAFYFPMTWEREFTND